MIGTSEGPHASAALLQPELLGAAAAAALEEDCAEATLATASTRADVKRILLVLFCLECEEMFRVLNRNICVLLDLVKRL